MTTTSTRQRSARTLLSADLHADHRAFPVRFTPTSGVTGLLRPEQNSSFRWVGVGSVLLDERGVHITARRLALFGLYRTTRLIHPHEIREVYREGNGIRIDLQTGAQRCFLRFWAADADSAAEIVDLLPTSRTIELERAPWIGKVPAEPSRLPVLWILLVALLVGVFALVGTTLLRTHGITSSHPAELTDFQWPPVSGSSTRPIPDVADTETRAVLLKFTRRFDALTAQFSTAFDALQRGNLSQEDFAQGLEKWLVPQWEGLAAELSAPMPATRAARADADALLKAVIDNWHTALSKYAHGLRTHDPQEVLGAFDYIRDAEAYERNAQALLD